MAAKKREEPINEQENRYQQWSAQAIATVLKYTKQKPLGVREGVWPHNPSGIIQVDVLVGGSPLPGGIGMVCPGYPRGRMIEVYGAESSGKTTLALAAIKAVQKVGGKAVYLDYENALHHGYSRACGVNLEHLHMYFPSTAEEGLRLIHLYSKMGADLVVVDSVAAMVPEAALKKEISQPETIGLLSRLLSAKLPRLLQSLNGSPTTVLFINQPRSTISKGPSHGVAEDNTTGGKAFKHYMSIRLKLSKKCAEYIEKPDVFTGLKKRTPYGNVVIVKVVKNKMDGKQGHTGEIFIRYGFGVDEYLGLIESAVPRKIITRGKGSYSLGGDSFKSRDKLRRFLIENPKVFEDVRGKVVQSLLDSAPQAVEDADDEDIVVDMRGDLEDDELAEGMDEVSFEEVTVEEAT
jgi:recombination protein RecA